MSEAQNNVITAAIDAAGINSPHNACQFRADCRKAEAQLAERDAEIARLRKVLGWVDGEWHDCEICKQLDVKNAEIARLRDALTSKGFVECGIPACDCGSWHHRYGLPERWAEIKEVLIDADVLNNDTGNMPLTAIKKLISQLAERDAEIARLRENVAPVISSRASEQTRRCDWCGEIAQGECGCAAETEIARLREDAARYCWLRQGEHGQPRTRLMQYHQDIHLDKAIDAARKS
jgi:hypothetical protein